MNKYKILNCAKNFSSGILQNYLVFISAKKYFKFFSRAAQLYLWKSKGMPEETIEKITTSDNTFTPTLVENSSLPIAKFNVNWFIGYNVNIFTKTENLYISYILDTWVVGNGVTWDKSSVKFKKHF